MGGTGDGDLSGSLVSKALVLCSTVVCGTQYNEAPSGKFRTQNDGNVKRKIVRFSMSSIEFGMMYFKCVAYRHTRNLAGKIHWFHWKS